MKEGVRTMELTRRQFLGASGAAAVLASAKLAPTVAAAEDDPLGVRKDFPALREYTFLNTAYIGLIPQAVADAGRDWLDARTRRTYSVQQMQAKTDEARKLFARMVGAGEDEVAFLFSTSEGENVVVNSLDFKPGDNVVIDDLVYPSTPVINRRLEKMKGVELRMVKHRNGAATVEDFAKLVDKRTRMISVALVSNISGFRHDMKGLADLAHANGGYLYADAVQAIGMGPVDLRALGIDFLTTGSYKWLMAGFGVAPFYVRRELVDRIQPTNVGWQVAKRLDNYQYEPYRTARKFEFASLAFGEIYQLAAALAYLQGIGLDKIEAQSLALVQQLRKGLTDLKARILTPEGNRSSIVSFYIRKESAEAQKILDADQIKVSLQNGDRTEAYGGTGPVTRVRVSLSFFNNPADVERFLGVASKLTAT
jgi:selenocysteine lyase/cysteine desulfurase